MSTKRIYTISYNVYWKADGKRNGFTDHNNRDNVFTTGGVKDAVRALEEVVAKRTFKEDKTENKEVLLYRVHRIDVASCELASEADIG